MAIGCWCAAPVINGCSSITPSFTAWRLQWGKLANTWRFWRYGVYVYIPMYSFPNQCYSAHFKTSSVNLSKISTRQIWGAFQLLNNVSPWKYPLIPSYWRQVVAYCPKNSCILVQEMRRHTPLLRSVYLYCVLFCTTSITLEIWETSTCDWSAHSVSFKTTSCLLFLQLMTRRECYYWLKISGTKAFLKYCCCMALVPITTVCMCSEYRTTFKWIPRKAWK